MSTTDWIGKKLAGRYEIEALLGQGGMSSVFKANDPNLKRFVAVKMIHEHLSRDPDFIGRFEEEAAAIAQLRHPNIVQVHDFNHEGDIYYMVMEFIPGETLQSHLKRLNQAKRSMPHEDVIKYIASICDASDYAHQRGMIHRDIKPANIMVSVQRQAILMDFGIAKILGGQQHTATGATVGTAQYMSPEQIMGTKLDQRSDVYSLGVTLFEMVSGHPPYDADSAMTLMMMHVHDPVPDIREINPEVPLGLAAVINKALAKSKEERYQTAANMAVALRTVSEYPAIIPSPLTDKDATIVEESPLPIGLAAATAVEVSGAAKVEPDLSAQATADEPDLPPSQPADSGKPRTRKINPLYLFGGGAIIILALMVILLGFPYISNLFSGGRGGGLPAAVVSPTQEPDQVALVDTQRPTTIPTNTPTPVTPTATSTPTPSPSPTVTLTPTATPTPTVPPGRLFARINNITINDQNRYVVEYETFQFVELIPCNYNVHFYFDSVSQENAGAPGNGPWIAHGGPRPFTGYSVFDRPAEANRMCILVANSNNTIHPDSGYCVALPTEDQTNSLSYFIGLISQSIFPRTIPSPYEPFLDPEITNPNYRVGGCG